MNLTGKWLKHLCLRTRKKLFPADQYNISQIIECALCPAAMRQGERSDGITWRDLLLMK